MRVTCTKRLSFALILLFAVGVEGAVDVFEKAADNAGFPLVAESTAAPICIPANADKVVRIAAEDFAEDVEKVTGLRPDIRVDVPAGQPAVRVALSTAVSDRWETFRLSATADAIVIQGSDSRALAFGLYDLSRRIGVSPWHWWCDVPVKKRNDLILSLGIEPAQAPAVRYRGIFLNDEDWGLLPWAAKTYEPEVGNIGPKTYARIFELLLRLRANAIWPAMHPGTKPFHQVPGNAEIADDYAIVVGASHAEPMLRNNVGEWKRPSHDYNFVTQRDAVLSYWEERVRERTGGESLFTLGMRGIHDSPIVGPKGREDRIKALEEIIKCQRAMIEKHLGTVRGNESRPRFSQIFCPYKEVLNDYDAGLKVPEDVTIVWPDDNFGYIRRFATPQERKRAGGLGVYYHLSYLGAPLSWLWFDSLPPALVWSEMTKAYQQGARTFWVANVGDLKGNELSTEFFLKLAWSADRADPGDSVRFLKEVAARDFGGEQSNDIAGLWARHQELAFARKPEHLQWNLPGSPYQPTGLTEEEIVRRLEDYASLERSVEQVADALPDESRDAYFQLVSYPIGSAAAANERYFRAELARIQKTRGEVQIAAVTFGHSQAAGRRLTTLTERYNNEIAGGKWRHIIRVNGLRYEDWKSFALTPDLPPLESTPSQPMKGSAAAPTSEPALVPAGARAGDFYESGRVISIHAGHFSDRKDHREYGWRSITGLGRSGSAVTVLPSNAEISPATAPRLSYRFLVVTGGDATVHVRLLPTHPLVAGEGLRLALALDGGPTLPVSVSSGFDTSSSEWKQRVLSNATHAKVSLRKPLTPGWHTLHLVAVDPGVVVDKFVIDLGGLKPSYDGPLETRAP
jgi:hypothetical protein